MSFPANQGIVGAIRELINALFKVAHEAHAVTFYQYWYIHLPGIYRPHTKAWKAW
jgi:hypothetical protein